MKKFICDCNDGSDCPRCSAIAAALREAAAEALVEDANWHDMAYREYRGKDGARAHIHMISADHARAKAADLTKPGGRSCP